LKTKYSAGLIAYSSFGGFKTLTETVIRFLFYSVHIIRKSYNRSISEVWTHFHVTKNYSSAAISEILRDSLLPDFATICLSPYTTA